LRRIRTFNPPVTRRRKFKCFDIYESATDVEAKEVLPAGW